MRANSWNGVCATGFRCRKPQRRWGYRAEWWPTISNGEKPVPKSILLACKGWEAGRVAGIGRVPSATYRLFRDAILERKQITCMYRGIRASSDLSALHRVASR